MTDAGRALELPVTAVRSALEEQTTFGLTSAEREQSRALLAHVQRTLTRTDD